MLVCIHWGSRSSGSQLIHHLGPGWFESVYVTSSNCVILLNVVPCPFLSQKECLYAKYLYTLPKPSYPYIYIFCKLFVLVLFSQWMFSVWVLTLWVSFWMFSIQEPAWRTVDRSQERSKFGSKPPHFPTKWSWASDSNLLFSARFLSWLIKWECSSLLHGATVTIKWDEVYKLPALQQGRTWNVPDIVIKYI